MDLGGSDLSQCDIVQLQLDMVWLPIEHSFKVIEDQNESDSKKEGLDLQGNLLSSFVPSFQCRQSNMKTRSRTLEFCSGVQQSMFLIDEGNQSTQRKPTQSKVPVEEDGGAI